MIDRIESPVGSLFVLDFNSIHFVPRRIYWLVGTPVGEVRGRHAHKTLQQYICCVLGSASIIVRDGLGNDSSVRLLPGEGYGIPPANWREVQVHSEDTVVLVIASAAYDADDYIYSYEEFVTWKHHAKLNQVSGGGTSD